jgi:hypothetical protein
MQHEPAAVCQSASLENAPPRRGGNAPTRAIEFDVTLILAYALTLVVVNFLIETLLVQPLERRASRWRIRAA